VGVESGDSNSFSEHSYNQETYSPCHNQEKYSPCNILPNPTLTASILQLYEQSKGHKKIQLANLLDSRESRSVATDNSDNNSDSSGENSEVVSMLSSLTAASVLMSPRSDTQMIQLSKTTKHDQVDIIFALNNFCYEQNG
jgi:hypothetical protein